ncbi:P2Y purinoceptor 1-like [Mantella aurantiaca]
MAVLMNYIYYKKSWTSSTIFIFNLALSDFFWIITVPISVFFSINKSVLYSAPLFCQFKRIFFNINIYGSIFFLMLISFDRYLFSVHPLTSPRWWDKKKAKVCTITIWLFIFIESIPDIYRLLTSKHAGQIVTCLDYIEEPLSFVVPITASRMLIGFLIPGTVIFTCYFCSLRVLIHLKDQCHTRRIRKPLMLITATLLVFLFSFAPYHIMTMVILFYRCNYLIDFENINLIFAFYEISQIVCSISFCADPIIFILANNKFKNQMKAIKCASCCRSNRVVDIVQ